ncbi:acyltransferase family protein [Corynebacterium sp. YSMAA1_1_F7]|uniref:acyltransferase family protein n=1 Tax=Corynebacterium sp. YSMAA1_1_F7 TaxID=3383590 RepID=UPI0038D06AEB
MAKVDRQAGRPRSRSKQRVEWADTAKGLSIIGVCIMHVVTGVPGGTDTALGHFSGFLDPLRMPLFFLVSGLFSHRILERSFTDLWYRRLWFLLVPYLVYNPFHALTRMRIDNNFSMLNLAKAMVLGNVGLWFLYALVLYNIFAWTLRKQPPWLAIMVSCIPLIVGAFLGAGQEIFFRHVLTFAPMFFIGLHGRDLFFRLARNAFRPWLVVGSAALFFGSEYLMRTLSTTLFSDWTPTVAALTLGTDLLRSLAALPFAIVVSVWICAIPYVRRLFLFVGRNTLQVYVFHPLGLFLLGGIAGSLAEAHPESLAFLGTLAGQLWWGIGACVVASAVGYVIGKTPYLGWTLFPPALRRPQEKRQQPGTSARRSGEPAPSA